MCLIAHGVDDPLAFQACKSDSISNRLFFTSSQPIHYQQSAFYLLIPPTHFRVILFQFVDRRGQCCLPTVEHTLSSLGAFVLFRKAPYR